MQNVKDSFTLITVGESSKSFPVANHVPGASENEDGEVAGARADVADAIVLGPGPRERWLVEAVLHVEGELDVVDSAEIHGAARLGLLRVEGCAPAVDVGLRNVGVRLVGGDETEVTPLLGGESRQVVELEVHGLDGVLEVLAGVAEPVVDVVLAFASHGPDELDDGVIEVQAHAHLRGTRLDLVALHLGDQLLERTGGEAVALVNVQVDVVCLDVGAQILLDERRAVVGLQDDDRVQGTASAGRLHAGLEVGEADVQLDAVELQGHDGERVAAALREPERQWDVETARVPRIIHQVLQAAILPDHFTQSLTRFTRQFFPHIQIIGVQCIYNLAADNEGSSSDEPLSDRVCVVGVWSILSNVVGITAAVGVVALAIAARVAVGAVLSAGQSWIGLGKEGHLRVHAARRAVLTGFDAWQVDDDVEVVDEISGSVEGQLRVAAEHHLGVERLLDGLHCEVGVAGIPKAPKRDCWVLRQILVRSAQRDKLSQSSSLGGSDCTTSHGVRFFLAREKKSSDEALETNAGKSIVPMERRGKKDLR